MGAASKRKPALERTGSEISSLAADGSENSGKTLTRQLRWQSANPIARWSHVAVASAIRRGILTKPDACEACGKVAQLDAHHDDHRLALDVRFWCRACHVRHHARKRKAGGT